MDVPAVFWVLASGEVWLARRMVNDFFCFLLILYMLVHLQRPAARAWFSYMRANGTEGHRLKWQRIMVALPWKNSENEWCCHGVGPHTLPMPFPLFLPSSLVCKMKAEGRVECRRRSSLGRDQPETLWLTFLFSLSLFSNHFYGCSFHFCYRCVWAYLWPMIEFIPFRFIFVNLLFLSAFVSCLHIHTDIHGLSFVTFFHIKTRTAFNVYDVHQKRSRKDGEKDEKDTLKKNPTQKNQKQTPVE